MPVDKSKILKNAVESSLYQYPYQNISLIDMVGEVWKELPDYEDLIMVSNMGRIKSVSRYVERISPKGDSIMRLYKPSIIRKQTINSYYNKSIQETCCQLRFGIRDKATGVKKELLTGRAVYMAFVSKEAVEDIKHTYVKHLDNDPFNNRVENLYVLSSSELHKKIIREERSVSYNKFVLHQRANSKYVKERDNVKKEQQETVYKNSKYPYQNLSLTDIEGEVWKSLPGYKDVLVSNMGRFKTSTKSKLCRNPRNKRMVQNEIKGQISRQCFRYGFNTYKNRAWSVLQFRARSVPRLVYGAFIAPVAKGMMVMHKDNDPCNNRIENLYLSSDKKVIAKYRLSSVTQYDIQGNPVASYDSVSDAGRNTGINIPAISTATKKLNKTAGGYLWRKGTNNEKIDVSGLIIYPKTKPTSRFRKVAKYDLSGNIISTYPTMTNAAKDNGCSIATIRYSLKRGYDVDRQSIWKYIE